MEHIVHAEVRVPAGKGAAQRLRKKGSIPGVVYGNHKEPVSIALDAKDFNKIFQSTSESTILTLKISGQNDKNVLIKQFDEDLIRSEVRHIDFYEVEAGKLLHTLVPIHVKGSPEGLKFGGVLEHLLHEVGVESLPKYLPEYIDVEVGTMSIGDSLHVFDLPSVEGVKYTNASDQVVVHIGAPRNTSLVPETDEEYLADKDEEQENE